jgi:quinol-cytochrome oxidoreductase complex cytochrome b subunit
MPQNSSLVNGDRGIPRSVATSAAAIVVQFVLQFACGLYLARAYIPRADMAHQTMERIMGAQPHAFIAGLHYWGSAVLILHCLAHVALCLWKGVYRPPNHMAWYGALLFLVSALLFQVTGNLLPFDRHGVQTAVVESGIASSVPVVGPMSSRMMLQGPAFSEQTLTAWYLVHRWILPLLLIVAAFMALSGRRASANKALMWAPVLIAVVLALLIRAPLGSAATPADFESYGAMPGWYVLPMHGALRAFSSISSGLGWIGSALLPGMFGAFLFALPWLSKRMTASAVQIAFAGFVGVFLILALGFGGRFAPLTGTRDPAAAPIAKVKKPVQPKTVDTALFQRGQQLFNSVGCSNCHGQDGKKPSGGPNLAKVDQRQPDPAWYVRFIKDPKSVKPGSTMPPFPGLSQNELRALAEFLSHPH